MPPEPCKHQVGDTVVVAGRIWIATKVDDAGKVINAKPQQPTEPVPNRAAPRHKVGDVILLGGRKFEITAVSKWGDAIAGRPLDEPVLVEEPAAKLSALQQPTVVSAEKLHEMRAWQQLVGTEGVRQRYTPAEVQQFLRSTHNLYPPLEVSQQTKELIESEQAGNTAEILRLRKALLSQLPPRDKTLDELKALAAS